MEFGEIAIITRNIVLTLSSGAMAVLGYFGLKAWQIELKGTSEYELAKEVLKAVYKVKNAFSHVRNPTMWSFEYPEKMLDDRDQLKREHNYEGTKHAYENRLQILLDAFKTLEDKVLDAQVEWGTDFEDLIIPFRRRRGELKRAISHHLEAKKEPENRNYDPNKRIDLDEQDSILFEIESDTGFDKKLNEAINQFEDKLRPHIRK